MKDTGINLNPLRVNRNMRISVRIFGGKLIHPKKNTLSTSKKKKGKDRRNASGKYLLKMYI